MTTRPADMSYALYKAMCASKSTTPLAEEVWKALPVEGSEEDNESEDDSEDEEDDSDDDSEDDSDDDSDDAEKSVKVGDLVKAMQAFDDVNEATIVSGGTRLGFLEARLEAGTISKSEKNELGRIWADIDEDAPADNAGRTLSKSLTEYLGDDDARVIDAEPLLKSLFSGLDDRLQAVQNVVASEGKIGREQNRAQGQLVKAMAGKLIEQDTLIKSLFDRLESVETTPAPRRAVVATVRDTKTRPLAKSVTGGGRGGATDLTKSQILSGINQLVKSAGEGNDFSTATKLTQEAAIVERGGAPSPGVLAAVTGLYST